MSQHAVAPEPDLSFPKGLAFETWATLTMPGDTPMTLFVTNANRQASLIPSRFTGKERDAESGNDYFGARYYSENDARFMSPDWSAKVEPVPYAKLGDPQSLNLYDYMLNNPLGGVDADGHSTLVFDGKTHTITLYSKSGTKLGTYPAYNNVDSHASIGKLVNGIYPMLDTTSPHLHPGPEGKENGAIGPGGIYRMKRFKGADGKPHSGVGVHAGRATKPDLAGRSGPAHATEGCIRTNDAGIAKITATVKTDPLTSTTVENNRTPRPPHNLTGSTGGGH